MSAASISQSFKDQFSADTRFAYQQQGSKLKSRINVDPLAAENGYFEYIKPVVARQRTGRAEEITPVNTEHERRKCSQKVFEASDYADRFEQALTNVQLAQAYSKNIGMALGREVDGRIISGLLGAAYSGRDGSTSVPFDTTNQRIAVNYVESGSATTSGLTLAKVRKTLQKLIGAEALPSDSPAAVTFTYTSNQMLDLLRICEELKVDNLTTMALAGGNPSVVFHGMQFVRVDGSYSGGLILPKSGANRSCVAFVRDAGSYCEVADIRTSIDWIPTRKSWLITGDFQADAARMRENGVVEILCAE